jgi:hypothetical protein
MLRDGDRLIAVTSGQEGCAAAMAAKSITSAAAGGCAGGRSAELRLAGGNGSGGGLLAWRSASGLAIAGGLIPTAAAAAETEPEDVGGRNVGAA